jgi:branched-chain amino acid transport system permease protein
MTEFIQLVLAGTANGCIYGLLALALVLIYRSTHIINFGQGEMAMFSTYICWSFLNAGMGYWVAVPLTLVLAFVAGLLVQRVLIRPVQNAPELTIVIVTLGLYLFFNSLALWIYSGVPKPFPLPAGIRQQSWQVGDVFIVPYNLFIFAVLITLMAALYVLFQRTKLGLGLRAAAAQPASSRLVGINVNWMLALGWGIAAAAGALAGILSAPVVQLEPNFMATILIFSFASATLGGFDSPPGAVVGGIAIGNIVALGGRYIEFIGTQLDIVLALFVIVAVLLIRPAGLFGRQVVQRV